MIRILSLCSLLVFLGPIDLLNARPKVGVALSGGGARGLAHIGVLKVLRENQVPVDYIGGTSMGAIVGGLYASGMTIEEIEEGFEKIDWDQLLFEPKRDRQALPFHRKRDHNRYLMNVEIGFGLNGVQLPPGLVFGQDLNLLLKSYTVRVAHQKDFQKLPIPFLAVATDLESGKAKVFKSGDLADVMQASAAYPGFLSPVEIEGRSYIDGGTTNNLPVEQLRRAGADVIIAVDVSSPLKSKKDIATFLDVTDQSITILMTKNTRRQLKEANIQLTPNIRADLFEFESLEETIESGVKSATPWRRQLRKWKVSEKQYRRWEDRRARLQDQPTKVADIKVVGNKRVSTKIIRNRIHLEPGDELELERLEEDLDRLYSTGDFETVSYELSKGEEGSELKLRIKEKGWGPNYLHFGLDWVGEVQGRQDFNALIGTRFTHLNSLGAQWRNDIRMGTHLKIRSEFRQPFDYEGLFFGELAFGAGRGDESFYIGDERVAIYEVDQILGEAFLGVELGRYGEYKFGLRKRYKITEVETGTLVIPQWSGNLSGFVTQLRIDQLDNAYMPTNGFLLAAEFYTEQDWLGNDEDFDTLEVAGHGAISFDLHTFFVGFNGGTSLYSELPEHEAFKIGGFGSFSGFRQEEVRGKHYGVGRVGYLFHVPGTANIFWSRMFLGGWTDIGKMWERRSDISFDDLEAGGALGLGLETKLGMAFLGYGYAGRDSQQFYVSLGVPFTKFILPF